MTSPRRKLKERGVACCGCQRQIGKIYRPQDVPSFGERPTTLHERFIFSSLVLSGSLGRQNDGYRHLCVMQDSALDPINKNFDSVKLFLRNFKLRISRVAGKMTARDLYKRRGFFGLFLPIEAHFHSQRAHEQHEFHSRFSCIVPCLSCEMTVQVLAKRARNPGASQTCRQVTTAQSYAA
jgi:hypothetical protein